MMVVGVSPIFLGGILIAILAYIAILKGLSREERGSPLIAAFGIILVFLGLTLPSFFNITEKAEYLYLTIGLMGVGAVLVLYSFFRIWEREVGEEKKRSAVVYPYLIGIFLLLITPVVFFYLFNAGKYEMAIMVSNSLVGVSLILMIFSLFSLGGIVEGGEGRGERSGRSSGKEGGGRFVNPFRELLDWIDKNKLFKLMILAFALPFVLSSGYIVLYYPEPPQSIVISNYNNYTVSYLGENYAKIVVDFPPNKTTLDLTLVVLFKEGHYEREVLLSDNDTKVVYVKKIEGSYTAGIKNLFTLVGLYNFWLPMLIVFLVVYGLLAKILVVEKGGELKPLVGKDVRILIAFSIALIFGASSMATRFVSSYLPYIGMGIITIIGLALIFSLIFPKGLLGAMEKSKFFKIFIYYIAFWLVIISLIAAVAPLMGTSLMEVLNQVVYKDYTFFDVLVSVILVLFIIIIVVSYVIDWLKEGKGGS